MLTSIINIQSYALSPSKVFGHCLLNIRQARGLSQKAVALDAGVDQSYLAGLETGRLPAPRDKQLQKLFSAMQMTETEKHILLKVKALYKLFQGIYEFSNIYPSSAHGTLAEQYLQQIYQELLQAYQYTFEEFVLSE